MPGRFPRRAALAFAALAMATPCARAAGASSVVRCYSSKVSESFRHPKLPTVEMQIGHDDAVEGWNLAVIVFPSTQATVQKIRLRSVSGEAEPAAMISVGVTTATFTSDEARAIAERGDFQVVAYFESGQRSCDIGVRDRRRLRLAK